VELRGKKASTSGEIGVGSLVKLPTTDLVGIVTVCRGQAVEVKWPDDKIRLHQRRFLIQVETQPTLPSLASS
jgi:hypothetical protein